MSKKYHISKNGTPAVCHAQPGNCPIGGNDVHFNSPEKALEYADNKNHLEVLNENLNEAANPYVKTSPQVGFCYSPYPERSVEFSSVDDLTLSTYDEYCEKNKDLLSKENHYAGTWHDPATGKIYLDVSINTMDAKEARKQCEDNDQIAYFDLQDFTSVTVNQNATSGQSPQKE